MRGLKPKDDVEEAIHIGRTPQGVRGLKLRPDYFPWTGREGRTPQGVRGLKHLIPHQPDGKPSRTPQGVRGLKPLLKGQNPIRRCRTPQGVRGLKLDV